MWIAVQERFRRFVADLLITAGQREDGVGKHINAGRALERAYYGANGDGLPPGLLVGSWGKGTQVRPSNDVDSFFILPADVKTRFDQRAGNVQSQLLQEVKSVLEATYPQTQVRGDGQVVVVAFNTVTLEIVPVFQAFGGSFVMPDTNAGGRWKTVDPWAQIAQIDDADRAMNGNVRALSQMMKHWRNFASVPLKSFLIELLVSEFLPARGWGDQSTFWYDFYVRDFLQYLCGRRDTHVAIPGTGEYYWLGSDWLSKAEAARDIAVAACHWEYHDYDVTAGQEWQKIFGPRIPVQVR
jgi:Second Messenger Oligonucleotide or Dinucleotide Synthetase domain